MGSAVGTVHGILLMRGNPCAIGNLGTALRVINAAQALGSGLEAYQDFSNGNYVMGTLNVLGVLGGVSNLFKACFVAGTPLLTPDGSKAIEGFKVGDLVLSREGVRHGL